MPPPTFIPETGVLQDHLQANAAVYTKRFLHATVQARDEETLHGAFSELLSRNTSTQIKQPGDIAAGLAWPQSEVRANVIHVPLSDLDSVRAAWGLGAKTSGALSGAVAQVSPEALGAILEPPPTQTLHL